MVTKEVVSFAFDEEDVEIDHIPLAEVTSVKIIREVDIGTKGSFRILVVDNETDDLLLQISTERDGHNSGRTYYLRCESKETLDALNDLLKLNSKAARKRAQARTGFQKVQYRVRKIYKSEISRWAINLLIGAVRVDRFVVLLAVSFF